MVTLLSSDGLITQISNIVALASMYLPVLKHSYDADFLRSQTTKTASIFLSYVMKTADIQTRKLFSQAQQEGDSVTAGVVLHQYLGGSEVQGQIKQALAATEKEITSGIQNDYEIFVRDVASRS